MRVGSSGRERSMGLGAAARRPTRIWATAPVVSLFVVALSGCMTLLHSDEAMRERVERNAEAQDHPDTPVATKELVPVLPEHKAVPLDPVPVAKAAHAEAATRAQGAAFGQDYAHSAGPKGRKLLRASVDQAFVALHKDGEAAIGLEVVKHPEALPAGVTSAALQRALRHSEFAVALGMESFLGEAASEVPMKFGAQRYKGQMPITEFFHRTLGSASFNTVESRLYGALAESRDPEIARYLQGLDRAGREALVVQMAHVVDDMIWTKVTHSELALRHGTSVALD